MRSDFHHALEILQQKNASRRDILVFVSSPGNAHPKLVAPKNIMCCGRSLKNLGSSSSMGMIACRPNMRNRDHDQLELVLFTSSGWNHSKGRSKTS